MKMPYAPMDVWTIGHSNVKLHVFLGLLQANGIQLLADVRSYPGSRHCPWFGREQLMLSCHAHGIEYRWIPELGGRRGKQSEYMYSQTNAGWRNESFRNYADYMGSSQFDAGRTYLRDLALNWRVAYMCSEALPWRCHRSLISDALVFNGWNVQHVMADGNRAHQPGAWGPEPLFDSESGRVTYPFEHRPVTSR